MKRTNFTFSFGSMALGGFLLLLCSLMNVSSLNAQCTVNNDLIYTSGIPTPVNGATQSHACQATFPVASSIIDDALGVCPKTVTVSGITYVPGGATEPTGCDPYEATICYDAVETAGDVINDCQVVTIDPTLCMITFVNDGAQGTFGCSDGAPADPTATDCSKGAVTLTQTDSTTTGTLLTGLMVTRTYSATALNGCASTTTTTTQTFTLIDATAPTALCDAAKTINLDGTTAGGLVTLAIADIDNGSSDNCPNEMIVIAPTTIDCGDAGNTVTVTLTITDEAGSASTCTTDIMVVDNTAPTASCIDPETIYLTAAGTATIVEPDLDNNSFDACGIASRSYDITAFDCADANTTTTVTMTVTDNSGMTDMCTSEVTVLDTISPVVVCDPTMGTLVLNANCEITFGNFTNAFVTATDNCPTGLVVSQSPLAGTVVASAHDMTHIVTLTATDASGNTADCEVIVTASDRTAPTVTTCPADRDVDLDASCGLVVPDLCVDAVFADNCGPIVCSQSPTATTVLPSAHNMTHSIIVTGTDAANRSVSCTVTLTAKDVTPPTLACKTTHTVTLEADGQYMIANTNAAIQSEYLTAAADNCTYTLSASMLNFSCTEFFAVPPVTNPVTVTVFITDGAGLVAQCDVDVIVEETPPVIMDCPDDMAIVSAAGCTQTTSFTPPTIGQCSYGITPSEVSITEPDGTILLLSNADFPANFHTGYTYSVGTTTVTYTYSSATGPDLTCDFDVVVSEAAGGTPPTLACGALVPMVQANTDAGVCFATGLGLTPAMSGDNCAGSTLTLSWEVTGANTFTGSSVAVLPAMPTGIPNTTEWEKGSDCPGVSTVVYTLTDSNTPAGTATCMFEVQISDVENPTPMCKATFEAELGAAFPGMVTINAEDLDNGSTDNCGGIDFGASMLNDGTDTGISLTYDCSDVATGAFPVSVAMMDSCGNNALCMTQVTIVDKEAPVIVGALDMTTVEGCTAADAPAAETTVAGIEGLAGGVTITDNCTPDAMIVVAFADTDDGMTCPVTVTRKYTLTDASGNSSEVEHVIKVDDTIAPTIAGALTTTDVEGCVAADAPAAYDLAGLEANGVTITDACRANGLTVQVSSDGGIGTCPIVMTRTYTVTDACDNVSASFTHTINIDDTVAPTVAGALTTTDVEGCVAADAPAAYDLAGLEANGVTITDACRANGLTVQVSSDGGIGTCPIVMTRTYTVTDACLNVSATFDHIINIDDTVAPTVAGALAATLVEGCTVADAPAAYDLAGLEANGVTITDACRANGLTVQVSSDGGVGTCPIVMTRTYTVTDACLNVSASFTHVITIEDTTAPTGTPPAGVNDLNGCISEATTLSTFDPVATATGYSDNCNGAVTVENMSFSVTGNDCNWRVDYTYDVVDECGNRLSGETYRDQGSDKDAPTGMAPAGQDFDGCLSENMTLSTFDAAAIAALYMDDCTIMDADNITMVSREVTGDDCGWSVKYTYNVADDCWNAMLTQTYTDTGSDKEAPAGMAPAGTTGIDACYADALTAAAFDATAAAAGYTDNCGTAVTAVLVSSTPAGDDCAWTVTHVYDVVDACNNVLAGESYIDAGGDKTAPTGTTPAAIIDINDCASNAPAFDAAYAASTYTDNCNNVTATMTGSNLDPTSDCGWTMTYTFSVADDCGNTLADQTYTVSGADIDAPTGTAPAAIIDIQDCASNAPAFDAAYAASTYSDDCSATVTATMTGSNLDPTSDCGWTMTYTFSVADDCGNTLTDQTYTVSGADTDAPTGTAPAAITDINGCASDAPAFDATYAASTYTDDCNNVTAMMTGSNLDPSSDCGWTMTYTFSVADDCGNTLTDQTYTVSGADATDPTPVCNNITITLDAGLGTHTLTQAEIDAIAAGSSDNCGTAVTWSVSQTDFDCASTTTNPNTVTLTVVDACGNDATCDAEITVLVGDNQPTAVCQDIDVTLDAAGNYTLMASEVDGGSTGCGDLTLSIDITDFDCSNVGPNNTITLTVMDATGNSDNCTAQVDVIASAICFPNVTYGNFGGPTIADPCTCRGNGEFGEEVFIQSNSTGQEFTIQSVTGLAPFMNGDLVTDNADGNYSAVGIHLDGVGYSIEITSRFFPGLVLTTSNTCFYPDAVINNDLSTICLNTPVITLDGDAGLQSDGTTPIVGTDGFTVNGIAATTLNAMTLGVGTHTVVYCFDAGTATGNTITNGVESNTRTAAMDDPGCEECITQIINIVETPDVLACNDVQVSLDENCEANVNPDMILEGTYLCFDDYSVQLTTASGSVVANPVGPSYWGQQLTATVTHLVSGNSCWGSIIVEDKLGPEFNCTTTLRDKMGTVLQSGTVFNITCDIDPARILAPQSIDNCDNDVVEYLISETVTGDECDVLTLTRVYGGEDSHGNAGNTCEITINITQPTVTFPEDITWTCEQYAAYSNITNPKALHYFTTAATASDLDPNWDDNIDNTWRTLDSEPNVCGTPTLEQDSDTCVYNPAGLYIDCDLNPGGHEPEIVRTPVHPTNLVDGLEDADVLERTGSGVPSVFEKATCKFTTTWEDQLLTACDGVSTDLTFKILRTWTVLNWCTGQVTTDVQVIKVTDEIDPVITFGDDFTNEFNADKYSDGDAHGACASSGPLDVPTFTDNCSGVDFESIRVYTQVGEGVARYDGAGNLVGFTIPAPYLTTGNHTVTYEVTDNCGNKTTADVTIRIVDGIAPVAICREITQIALNGNDGITEISPESFNEASYDNCSSVFFKVRRMEEFGCDRANVDTPNEIRNASNTRDDREWFDDKVKFCCADIGDSVNVILRVYDLEPIDGSVSDTYLPNNSNDCMIRVLVEDKARPECDAPEDVWTSCDEVADNLDLTDTDALAAKWGTAITRDNCGADANESAPIVDLDLCGVGTVTRNWVAVDAAGNRSLGRCQQVIMIMAKNSYKIVIPGDFEEECDDAAPAKVEVEEYACDLLAINSEKQDFPASPAGECKKEIITWRVINWCEYDGASAPTRLARLDLNKNNRGLVVGDGVFGDGTNGTDNSITGHDLNEMHMYVSDGTMMMLVDVNGDPVEDVNGNRFTAPSTGYYEYKQHVKIFDNTAPDVSYDGDTQFCGGDRDEDPCTGPVDLPINASDLCTNTTTTWELSAFSDSFVSADFQGNGTLSGRYPLGTHTVRYYVEDECRNISQLDITFEIIDCKAPTPVCYNGLSVSLMPTGMVSVWASDIDASSFDYCHPIQLTANVVTDVNGDGFVNADDYLTTPPTSTEVMVDCNNVGTITYIQLWVGEVSADDVNNWDYCVTYIDVQDNLGACAGSKVALGGKITNEEGESVEDVRIDVNNGMSAMTSADGQFNFAIPTGSDITVTPMKNDEITNGVSTFDLLLISKHILNVERLDSPFKMIAADANNSNNISTLDLIEIRKVILRVSSEFTNNTSWRFVDKKYAFQDANNPLNEAFAEAMSMNNMSAPELNANFTAVKIGDVNGDATPNSILGVDGRTFNGNMILKASEQNVKAGEEFTVTFTAAQDVQGYQFTLDYDEKAVELVTIENGLTNDNNFNVVNNQIATSWNENVSTKNQEMFSLVFVARADVQVSNILSVNSAITTAEAYGTNGEMMNISLDFGQGATAATFELMQNNPNPFDYETTIGFTLPEASSATMTISDVSGKVLRVIEGDYAKGYNEVKLQRTSDLPTGVLIYELETPTNKATRKMTAVK